MTPSPSTTPSCRCGGHGTPHAAVSLACDVGPLRSRSAGGDGRPGDAYVFHSPLRASKTRPAIQRLPPRSLTYIASNGISAKR